MSLDRLGAIVWLADHSRNIIDARFAREIAVALGVPFERLLDFDKALVRKPVGDFARDEKRRHGWLVGSSHVNKDLVQVSDLAAAAAAYMGLYANIDHAKQAPHGTPGKLAQYIGQRAALRMARYFWPDGSGERDLLQEVPGIAGAGVGRIVKDEKTGEKVYSNDGSTPLVVGKDALLRERVYKP